MSPKMNSTETHHEVDKRPLVVNVANPDDCVVTNRLPLHERLDRQTHDQIMRAAVAKAQDLIGRNRQKMVDDLGDWEGWRARAEQIRQDVLENLDAYLYKLSEEIDKRGGNVFFARTKEEATDYILSVIKAKNAKKVVKSKSMVTEEIGLNHVLEGAGVSVLETDLGEFLLQLAKDPPSHVVVPAIHRDRRQIQETLRKTMGYTGSDTPEDMTLFVRKTIRPEFFAADVGISGCNFAVAESGSMALVSNEGNARLCTTLPKTHIAVMGMERLAPSFAEVDVLITMLARSAVGQRLTGYNTWLTPPKRSGELDGPEEFHLVIIDNGRSDILASQFSPILQCIRCGACMNTCPCYREVGGHGYGSIYPGPLGAVLTPLIGGYEKFRDLPQVCTLCTACDSVCPVKIPLSGLIRRHRIAEVEMGIRPTGEKLAMKGFGVANGSPWLWNLTMKAGAPAMKLGIHNGRAPIEPKVIKAWTNARDLPEGDGESFRTWFAEHEKSLRNQKNQK